MPEASPLKPDAVHGLDILLTRENTGGIYQGHWEEQDCPSRGRLALHHFAYTEEPGQAISAGVGTFGQAASRRFDRCMERVWYPSD